MESLLEEWEGDARARMLAAPVADDSAWITRDGWLVGGLRHRGWCGGPRVSVVLDPRGTRGDHPRAVARHPRAGFLARHTRIRIVIHWNAAA
jgi:hypothetical protein